jgi:UDP-N-acetylmuramoyl-L-alanyl-D-glutamate--2,6-diaminopimelate ligase
MTLAKLLEGVQVSKMFAMQYGKHVLTHDVNVRAVQYDSRKVERGDLFVAIRGTSVDGHAYIQQAVERGAVAVIVENDAAVHDFFFLHALVLKIVVQDSRKALAQCAANFYGHPSAGMRLIGVTGTNGKTTTTHLIKAVLEAAGEKAGLIGTIRYQVGTEDLPATHTTPESLELQALFATMRERGCASVVMEVSSHALAMHRVEGARFAAGVFTNLTQDHLDFHGSMESYFAAKKILFDSLATDAVAVTNLDDRYGSAMVRGTHSRCLTYGAAGEVKALDVSMSMTGMSFTVARGDERFEVRTALTGRFNVQNVLATAATGLALGIDQRSIARGLQNLTSVRGRFEQIPSPAGWVAVIDYAHTPDALENCLATIRGVLPAGAGRVLCVFGCGGDRDRGKRPIMGRIATRMSDVVIVTSDNPRFEEPDRIIADILAGVGHDREVRVEPDRRTAIHMALELARPGDVVLVAGKGHEDYQSVLGVKTHLDDREEVETFIREHR